MIKAIIIGSFQNHLFDDLFEAKHRKPSSDFLHHNEPFLMQAAKSGMV